MLSPPFLGHPFWGSETPLLLLLFGLQIQNSSKAHPCIKIPWGSKPLHACRKLLGNYFSGFQVIITCMITCRKFLGNYFSALSGNFAFYYLCRIFLLPEISPKFKNYLGENFPLYWPSPPALSSSFLLRVVCRLAWMQNESVLNAWPELGAKRKPLEYAKTTMNPCPQKRKARRFALVLVAVAGSSPSLREVHAHTYTYIYIYAVGLITWPSKVNNLAISFLIFFCCFCFSKIFFFLQGEWDFWKKTS